jgi:hypothetical protein
MNAGDFDLLINPDDLKAYTYFERVHSELICADLTDDYTDVTGYYSTHFPHPAPPQVREGPAYFHRRGKHYMITSGTTDIIPIHPKWRSPTLSTDHGPCWATCTPRMLAHILQLQVSSVFKHPAKKDLYIALADRWIPDLPAIEGAGFASGDAYRRFEPMFAKMFNPDGPALTPAEGAELKGQAERINTSRGTYVWLPLRFEGDRPFIDWRSAWSPDDFA